MKSHIQRIGQLNSLHLVRLLGTTLLLTTGCGASDTTITSSPTGSGGSGTVATCQTDAQCLNGYSCSVGVCVKNQGNTGGSGAGGAATGGATSNRTSVTTAGATSISAGTGGAATGGAATGGTSTNTTNVGTGGTTPMGSGGLTNVGTGGAGTGGAPNTGGAPATSTGGSMATTTTGGATGTCASASPPGSPTDYYACSCNCTFTNTANSGIWTHRCVTPSDPDCASCSASCSAIATDNASNSAFGTYISGSNSPGCSLTNVPVQWSCQSAKYGSGDGCDCGCGALDPDCSSASSTACAYCADSGSCASSCSAISSTNNATCTNVPAGWRCAPALYGSGDGCDCGCGIKDPDCTSAAASVCQYDGNGGSCIFGCSSINTTNNAVCQ